MTTATKNTLDTSRMYETENDVSEPRRSELNALMNQRLADAVDLQMQLKQAHWNVKGPHFIGLHELFDQIDEAVESYVDLIAERIQLLGGVSIAMAHDVAELTKIPRPPKGREEVPVQISRLLEAHELVLAECRMAADRANDTGDQGTNDLLISDVVRTNELQAWFVAEHVVDTPIVKA